MSWRDRDYARVEGSGAPRGRARSLPFGGSVISTLIAANVAVYVLAALSAGLREAIYGYGALTAESVTHGQVWRLFTAQYLHAGTGHLFLNMIGLHFLGRPLEQQWSARRLFGVYTACGLAGNLFFVLLGWRGVINPQMPAVGASGCIYGLLGIVAVLYPNAVLFIHFLFPVKVRTAALIFAGIAFLTVLERGPNYGGEACHLAGLVFGVWWAWRGEAWWGSTEWRWRGSRRPGARRIREATPSYLKPSEFAERVARRRISEEELDRVLKKVHDSGIHSLSESEKQVLREASEQERDRDAKFGRIDRM